MKRACVKLYCETQEEEVFEDKCLFLSLCPKHDDLKKLYINVHLYRIQKDLTFNFLLNKCQQITLCYSGVHLLLLFMYIYNMYINNIRIEWHFMQWHRHRGRNVIFLYYGPVSLQYGNTVIGLYIK